MQCKRQNFPEVEKPNAQTPFGSIEGPLQNARPDPGGLRGKSQDVIQVLPGHRNGQKGGTAAFHAGKTGCRIRAGSLRTAFPQIAPVTFNASLQIGLARSKWRQKSLRMVYPIRTSLLCTCLYLLPRQNNFLPRQRS